MVMRLRINRYAAIVGLVAAGLISLASAASEAAAGAFESCATSPDAGTVRSVAAPESALAGQAVHFRIDNSKGPAITYGTPYSVQECLAGVWVLASFSPAGPWTKQKIAQKPSHGRWRSVLIPTTAAAGQYRIRKSAWDGERWHSLYGDFDVVAPGI
jgi:hypothetical protein